MKANQAKTPEAKAAARHKLSTYPRAPRHGKHTELQGYPNTRGGEPLPKTRS